MPSGEVEVLACLGAVLGIAAIWFVPLAAVSLGCWLAALLIWLAS